MNDKQAKPGRPWKDAAGPTGIGVKRPLIPVVLALMAGLAAAAWGFKISWKWLVIGLAGLLAVLIFLHRFGSVRGPKGRGRGGLDEPAESSRKTDSKC